MPHDGSECCSFTTLRVVILILAFFAIIFVSFMPAVNDEFTWTNFESHSCTTYATREYVAELNVSSWNRHRMEICMATSADVHGLTGPPVVKLQVDVSGYYKTLTSI